MKNYALKVIAIVIIVGFAATSFAVMSNYGVHKPSVGRRADNIVKPMASNSVINTIPVGSEPVGVAFNSLNGDVYVANYGSNTVTVINDTNKAFDTITVGSSPYAVAFNSLNGYMYVTNAGSDSVSVINGTNKVVGTITVGHVPDGVAFDSLNGYVYVANLGSNSVSVISPTYVKYPVKFSETGLPLGSVWYVTLSNGISGFSLSSTLCLSSPNGTYSYTISTVNHTYKLSKALGSITINGSSPPVISVKFTEVTYSVIFTESNLPSGSTWYLNLSNGQTFSSTTSNISISEPNETYSYTIATSNHVFTPSTSLGILTVNGKPVSDSIRFSKITYSVTFIESGLPSGSTWYVNITESNGTVYHSGSISGSSYSFSLSNGTYSYTIGKVSGYNTFESSGSITVNGKTAFQLIDFSPLSSTAPPPKKPSTPSSSNTDLYIIIGAVAAVAVVGAVAAIMIRKKK